MVNILNPAGIIFRRVFYLYPHRHIGHIEIVQKKSEVIHFFRVIRVPWFLSLPHSHIEYKEREYDRKKSVVIHFFRVIRVPWFLSLPHSHIEYKEREYDRKKSVVIHFFRVIRAPWFFIFTT